MMHYIRVWITLVMLLGIQSCDVFDEHDSGSGEFVFANQSSLKLSAPSILTSARAVTTDLLSVEVRLTYLVSGEIFESVQPVGPSASGRDPFWELDLAVPSNTPFTLSMTWYEQGTQRLDLIRITREFEGYSNNGRVVFTYNFVSTSEYSELDEAPDYAGFDADGDDVTNLEERLAMTDPFDAVIRDGFQKLNAIPVSLDLKALTNDVGTETIVLRNADSAVRDFTAISNSPWLVVETGMGNIAADGAFDLNVTYSCDNVENVFSGTVNVQSENTTTVVPVQLTCVNVADPLLSAVTPGLNLDAETSNLASAILTFKNTGTANLNYTLTSDSAWLTAQFANGVVQPGMAAGVEITATCGATEQSRNGTLSLESDGGNATIPITQDCTEPDLSMPVLADVLPVLSLTTQSGESAASTISLTNSGDATLTYEVASDSAWLSVARPVGSIGASGTRVVAIEARCDDFTENRSGQLIISSDGGTDSVDVSLICQTTSLSVVSPVSLNLSAISQQAAQSVLSLSNTGNANLSFAVVSDSNWLTTQVTQGQVEPGLTQTIGISAACGSIEEVRTGSVVIESGSGNTTVPVTLNCALIPLSSLTNVTPSLTLSSQSGQSTTSSISLSNSGDAELAFQVSSDSTWLSVEQASGSIAANTSAMVSVVAQCVDFTGNRSGQLSVASSGGNAVVPVSINCTALPMAVLANVTPSLTLSAQTGENATSTINLSNSGDAALTFEITSENAWLTVGSANGSIAANASTTVPVDAQCSSVAGDRVGQLMVTSTGGSASVPITVNCTAAPVPKLANVTPALSLSAQAGESASSAISLSNAGNAGLNFEIVSDSTWLTVGEASGTIAENASTTIPVAAQCASATGERSGKLDIISNGGNATVSVTLNCTAVPAPKLANVTPDLSLTTQHGVSANSTISLSNTGNAELNFTLTSDSAWLTVGTASGSIQANASTTVSVAAVCASSNNDRTGKLTITSDGGNDSVAVSLTCQSATLSNVTPSLRLIADVLETAQADLSLSNTGSAVLNVTVTSDSNWISTQVAQGQAQPGATQSIGISATCGTAQETRTGVLSIGGNGGNATVPVTLDCNALPTPKLANVTPSLDLSAEVTQSTQADVSLSNTGNAVLNFTIASESNWITTQVAQGQAQPGATQRIGIIAICGTATETRRGVVNVTSNGGNATVAIVLNCTVPLRPILADVVSSVSMDTIRAKTTSTPITLRNSGTARLNYEIASDSAWLSVDKAKGGIAANASTMVSVQGSCIDFNGERTGKLSISSDGGEDTVEVFLICFGAELGNVNPQSFALKADYQASAQSTLVFSNIGNASLVYSVKSDSDWLCLSIKNGPACKFGGNTIQGSLDANSKISLAIQAKCPGQVVFLRGSITVSGETKQDDVVVPVTLACSRSILVQPSELSMSHVQAKTFSFNWSDQDGADYYQVLESTDGVTEYEVVSPKVAPGKQAYNHSVGLHLKEHASYKLQSCNAVNVCVESAAITVKDNLVNSIGYIKGPTNSSFGADIDISGDGETMAVLHATDRAVSIYRKSVLSDGGIDWSLDERIGVVAAQHGTSSSAAISLSHDGNRLVMGLPDAAGANCDCISGAAYVMSRNPQSVNGQHWTLEDILYHSVPGQNDAFGTSVAMNKTGTRVLIGSPGRNEVHEFAFDVQNKDVGIEPWHSVQVIQPAGFFDPGTKFGSLIQVSSDFETLAASGGYNAGGGNRLVYVFEGGISGAWLQTAELRAGNNQPETNIDMFGFSLSVSGDGETIAVGAIQDLSNTLIAVNGQSEDSVIQAGAVYVFARNGGQWNQQAYLKASNPSHMDFFGYSVNLDFTGNLLAVSAWSEDSQALGFGGDETDNGNRSGAGAGYLFSRENRYWQQTSYFKASQNTINVGTAIDISDDGQSLFMTSPQRDEIYFY